MCGKTLCVSWRMEYLEKSLGQKPSGPAAPLLLALGLPKGLHCVHQSRECKQTLGLLQFGFNTVRFTLRFT